MRDYTISAAIGNKLYTRTENVFQYDYGLKLVVDGVTLPYGFVAEFSNDNSASAKRVAGENNSVYVPNEYLQNGEDIHAYIRVSGNGGNSDYVVYHIHIPVIARPAISEEPVTQTEHEPVLIGIPAYDQAEEGSVLKIVSGVPAWVLEE